MPDEKIPCIKEMRPATGKGACVWRLEDVPDLADLFDGAGVGERVVFEYCEMTEAELDALPEFEGW
jgi:hypothetical protein